MNNTLIILSIIVVSIAMLSISIAYSIHSITICGHTYTCGNPDGVCPAEFPGVTTKCDSPDPDCPNGATGNIGGAIFSPQVYNCTKNEEKDIFYRIDNNKIYSLDGFCLDLKVLNANINGKYKQGELEIIKATNLPEIKGYSTYKEFKINYTIPIKNSTVYFRVSDSWAKGVVRDSISLYYLNGTKIKTRYLGTDQAFLYYTAEINGGAGIYYIAGKNRPTIWYVIEEIDKYYAGQISFVDVVKVILDYYS